MQNKYEYLCEERFPQGWPIEEMIMSYARNQRKAIVRKAKADAALPDGAAARVRRKRGGRKKETIEAPSPDPVVEPGVFIPQIRAPLFVLRSNRRT